MNMRILPLLLASCGMMAAVPPGCHNPSPNAPDASDGGSIQPILDATQTGTNDVCYLIEGIDTSGVTRTICAIISEIIAVIGFIDTLRTTGDAGPPASTQCQNLPKTTYCATSAERAKGIQFISNLRAARQKF